MGQSNEESKALQFIEQAVKMPLVRVNRDEFLVKTFSKSNVNKGQLLEKGPVELFTTKELDKAADKAINSALNKSTSASFLSGLPGGIALAATVPADIAQFYGFTLRLAQELSYIYGGKNLFDEDGELSEESKNTLILYLGVMLGVTAAGSAVRVMSAKASQQALKSIPTKSLTKTVYYPVLKKALKVFGVKLTKQNFAKGVSKIIPLAGGVISGGLNYASLRPMAKKLKNELSSAINQTEENLKEDVIILENLN